MIADTSIWIEHFLGKPGDDLELFRIALNEGRVVMAPVVLSELLSSTEMTSDIEKVLSEMPFASPTSIFWRGAGKLRGQLAKHGMNASLADCLVMQSCLEHDLPLLTRDKGIKKFSNKAKLRLILS